MRTPIDGEGVIATEDDQTVLRVTNSRATAWRLDISKGGPEVMAALFEKPWLVEIFRPDGTRLLGVRPDLTVEMGEEA